MARGFRKIAVLIFLVFGLSAAYASGKTEPPVIEYGTDGRVTITQSVAKFNKLRINITGTVRYHVSPENRVVIQADSGPAENVVVDSDFNTLKITMNKKMPDSFAPQDLDIDIYGPHIGEITITGTGSLELTDKIITPSMKIKLDGTGSLDGSIDSESLDIKITGTGTMRVAGRGGRSKISIMGSGIFAGSQFETRRAVCRITGDGAIEIGVSEFIKGTISGPGIITYHGNPRTKNIDRYR